MFHRYLFSTYDRHLSIQYSLCSIFRMIYSYLILSTKCNIHVLASYVTCRRDSQSTSFLVSNTSSKYRISAILIYSSLCTSLFSHTSLVKRAFVIYRDYFKAVVTFQKVLVCSLSFSSKVL